MAGRFVARILAVLVLGISVVVFPQSASAATPVSSRAALAADLCSVEEWQADPQRCLGELPEVASGRLTCLNAPPPDAPDAGLGGWFAERSAEAGKTGIAKQYTDYGYAGYSYTTYDIGCAQ